LASRYVWSSIAFVKQLGRSVELIIGIGFGEKDDTLGMSLSENMAELEHS
jgi:hypothetical protein